MSRVEQKWCHTYKLCPSKELAIIDSFLFSSVMKSRSISVPVDLKGQLTVTTFLTTVAFQIFCHRGGQMAEIERSFLRILL